MRIPKRRLVFSDKFIFYKNNKVNKHNVCICGKKISTFVVHEGLAVSESVLQNLQESSLWIVFVLEVNVTDMFI